MHGHEVEDHLAADRGDPAGAGGDQQARHAVLLGGPGTREVTEFAAAGFGARIGRSPYAAARLIADALDLHHRHPQLWARVQAGEVRASYARHVTARTRDLEPGEAAYVDAGVVESADGRICWSRFEALVEAKVAQAAPAAAREREQRAAKARFARTLGTDAHGMATFLVRADNATIKTIDAAVGACADRVAAVLPDAPDLQTVDERRVHAVLLLASGTDPDTGSESDAGTDIRDLLPKVQLFVHLYAGPDREDIARVEGHGPVTEAWVRSVLGPRARFTIRPVLDLAGQAPVDAYEIPERHRRAVHLMTPADTFPFASGLDRLDHRGGTLQIDHTVPYDQGGVTGVGNYGPMTTTHHRIKTHGRWQVQQPFPGIYCWRDPHGAHYLVDHTGTRQLPDSPAPAQTEPTPPRTLVIELWRTPIVLDLNNYAA